MKIYLAGPMRGVPGHNFPAFFAAAHQLRAAGHLVFNPAEHDQELIRQYGEVTARQAFHDDTSYICLHADAVALLPGWSKSKGATAEKALADALGLEVLYL